MALFQRQQIRKELVVPYTISSSDTTTLLIVGLGNPGKKYEGTRHNIGFAVADEAVKNAQLDPFTANKQFNGEFTMGTVGSRRVIVLKPSTFMNESGTSVQAVLHYYKIPLENCVVIHDELSINFGQIRMRIGGQAAGHNGIKSLITHIGSDFSRIRIGIKNERTPTEDTSSFVLATFTKEEKAHMQTLINEAALVVDEFIYSGKIPHDTRSILLS